MSTAHTKEGRKLKGVTVIKAVESAEKVHAVWVGESDRIASFHEVDSYELQTFACHDFFINYLCSLQKRGFRFQ